MSGARHTLAIAVTAALALGSTPGLAQPPPRPEPISPPQPAAETGNPPALPGAVTPPANSGNDRSASRDAVRVLERRHGNRLTALTPADPGAYFLLAEEIADGASKDAARKALAVRLYVLAYELARGRAETRSLAASACLGLASVTGTTRDRQFLESLARTLEPRHLTPGWIEAPEIATSDSGGYRLAVLLGEVRTGEGIRARRLLDDPTVAGLLERYDGLLGRSGLDNGAFTVRREAERWPCSECRNERVVRRSQAGQVEYRLCPICGGLPGPRLTSEQLLLQLRFEAWLLQGSQRSWAAQLGVDGGAPLVDPDASRIGALFQVDETLVLWRNGQWIEDPNAPKPAPVVKPPEDEPAEPQPPEAVPLDPATSSS